MQRSPRRGRGFTLMEILVVLAILGLLAGLAINRLGRIFDDAKVQTAALFINTTAKTALMSYNMHMRSLPTTEEGMRALVVAPANRGELWRGPYFDSGEVPLDPWGEPYQYAYPGKHNKDGYDIWSKGPDRQSDTDDDIGNWKPAKASEPASNPYPR